MRAASGEPPSRDCLWEPRTRNSLAETPPADQQCSGLSELMLAGRWTCWLSIWILSGADRELVQCTNFIPNKESEKLLRIRTWNLINCHLTE